MHSISAIESERASGRESIDKCHLGIKERGRIVTRWTSDALIISSPRALFVYECVQLHKKDEGEQRRFSLLLICRLLVPSQDCWYLLCITDSIANWALVQFSDEALENLHVQICLPGS